LGRDLELLQYRPPTRQIRRLISVGRLVEKKGHLDAIAAVGKAIASGLDLNLTIIGTGPLRSAIEQSIERLGLKDRIQLCGSVPNGEVLRLMRESDALLLCSKTAEDGDQEGTPTVIVEAQALGLPCITTIHAGIPEMLPEEHHHLLAPEGDVSSISERIIALCAHSVDELELMSARGREKVENDFAIARECARLIGVYESVALAQPTSVRN
jgi:colanic acid/amylovoran biosynthesis glycosyltransferase